MDSKLIKLKDCPFCLREQVVVFSNKQPDFPVEESDTDCQSGRPFVLFCAHTVTHEPCAHLVHLEVECRERDVDRMGLDESAEYDSFSYRHPALKAADPDHELVRFLRHELSDPHDEVAPPDTPFRFVMSDVEGSVHDSHEPNGGKCGKWWATSEALYAKDAERFVRECKAMNDMLSLQEASE